MNKNAIIDIIENDLKEMLTLLSSFKEGERIPNDFIELLAQKHAGLGREVALLNYWASENLSDNKEVALTAEVKQPIAHDGRKDNAAQEDQPRQPRVIKITKVAAPKTIVKPVEPVEPVKSVEPVVHQDVKSVRTESPVQSTEQTNASHLVVEPVKDREVESPKPEPAEKPVPKQRKPSATDITTYGTPVNDIKKAIGFNDRFLYQKEIFGGNSMAYDAALETINASADYAAAYDYLMKSFKLDETQPVVEAFLKAVHRRFL